MKLLYITNGINGSGGLERVLSIKASYFAEVLGYEVHILGLNNTTSNLFYEFSTKITYHDIIVTGNPINYLTQYINGIKNTIKKVSPDVILVCDDGLKAFFLPTFLGKSRPIIYERHVSKSIEIRKDAGFLKSIVVQLKIKLMDFLAPTFSKFVVLTQQNTNEWKTNNLVVISNPLSFYPQESSSLTNKKVIAVGKQSYQKGYDLLLKAWQIVNQINPNWQLEIYGKLDQNQGLEQLANELKIQNSVQFFPPEKNIQQKYLESSIYVMSSRFEGFGMVLIEAMACGVPCVSFDCKYGPSDIIKNNEDGFVVENGNTNQLAEKLLFLIENEVERKIMGTRAKENVKRYLPENVLQQWNELFKEIVK